MKELLVNFDFQLYVCLWNILEIHWCLLLTSFSELAWTIPTETPLGTSHISLRSMPPRHWGQCLQGIEVNAAKALRSMPPRHWGQCRQGIEVNAAKALMLMPTWHWGQCRNGIEFNAYINIRSKPTINMSTQKIKIVPKLPSSTHLTHMMHYQTSAKYCQEGLCIYIFCFPWDCLRV